MVVKEYTVNEVYKEAIKDKEYFESFDGGVTISGGEATIHHVFVKELLMKLKADDIHTALDTAGHVKWDVLKELLPYIDCVLYDVKLMDSKQHKHFTGVDNALILENLDKLIEYKKTIDNKLTVWIRTPLIPFATAKMIILIV